MKNENKNTRSKKSLTKISKAALGIVLGLTVQFLPIGTAKNWGNAYAACTPAYTTGDDDVTCTGAITSEQPNATDGNDTTTVESGASIIVTGGIFRSIEISGSGNKTVINNGTITANHVGTPFGSGIRVNNTGIDSFTLTNTGLIYNNIDPSGGVSAAVQVAAMASTGVVTINNSGTIESGKQAIDIVNNQYGSSAAQVR